MSKMRLLKAGKILSELLVKNSVPKVAMVEYVDREDRDRQLAVLREDNKVGMIICFPKKRKWPEGHEGQDFEYSSEQKRMVGVKYE